MSAEQSHPFIIEEVIDPHSQYLHGMDHWLELIFPEYCPSRFDKLLSRLRSLDGRHQIQIFIALVDNHVAGLVQLFYREWHEGLLADIDLLGVLEPYRRYGIASALVQQTFRAIPEMAQQYHISPIGAATLIDSQYAPIVRLHKKLGGQIRTDYHYPSGDIIVWYPMQQNYEKVATPLLGEQFRQFGKLLEV